MQHAAHHVHAQLPRLLLLLLIVAATEACTVLQFTEHAFSANTERLLRALPLFDGTNGTLYLDTALSTHKCYPNGGWQDYFELGTHAGNTAGCTMQALNPKYIVCGSSAACCCMGNLLQTSVPCMCLAGMHA